ncbi:MAG: hypothetical protein E7633_00320 [Ruminococcaceae bacterium]|nr:hypothetical protein [Oscillospiraceae bacterium]
MDWLRNISTLELVVWSIAIGSVWAIFCTYYNRTILGGFVRTLINSGALSVDSAMTLAEAGYQKNTFIKRALVKRDTFRKIVFEVDDEIVIASEGHSFSARTKPIDLNTARFYVAEENKIMAELRYDNKGADIFGVVSSVIIILALAYIITLVLPLILTLF